MSSRQKLIVIVGPTASGKSELAVRLAKKFNGEIISADSRQIYRGLDIGTGKISKKEMRGVPHHLLNVAEPKQQLTVVGFRRLAGQVVRGITSRGKIPIIVGGTGFWIDALIYNINLPTVPPNSRLRKKLVKKRPAELLKILQKLDPRRAKTIEQKNPRRLIRAIEVAKIMGEVPRLVKHSPYNVFWLGLRPSKTVLRRKIEARAATMIQKGLIKETKKLLRQGMSKKRIQELGFEYRGALSALEQKLPRSELLYYLVRYTLKYARRQMVWFRRNSKIHWIRSPSQLNGTNIKKTLFCFLASRSHPSKS
ncbi:MAG: tRNA (adenosine(37)-N6)-dimethylallyltransferase MiaA [Candidatus Sungiibacteriota bacterium]|uniref:tRNA dimethylallyltransferase n=1 Tax=Candidatus Sungiibacteriota bacterium TaxID=2750080 RepID=A0A7T5UQD1_9BACT|nr:MAG: tRNA (adenosine(37)-N6)-dimethylallyltransferase MiaA [Candidatus Sungbacteria bacterium]